MYAKRFACVWSFKTKKKNYSRYNTSKKTETDFHCFNHEYILIYDQNSEKKHNNTTQRHVFLVKNRKRLFIAFV